MDVTFDLGGFPLYISAVHLEEGTGELPFKLVFETEVGEGAVGTLETVTVGLGREVANFGGAAHGATTIRSRAGKLEPTLSLAALPPGPFTLVIDSATMAVDGRWELSWDVPE